GITAHSTNNQNINDTIIYHTRRTATTHDDFVLMVLEDYTAFGFSDFELLPPLTDWWGGWGGFGGF
ncbi:MAG: hypothetical protein OXT03_06830, partial [Alphaproteobacteria bacterium]|nr:hypothetical protein [Alphaproteobacteria bacterium]